MLVMEELYGVFDEAEAVNVYRCGAKETYVVGEDAFARILKSWNLMLEGCRQMPAFGVSLNRYTVEELKSGLWTEFVFNTKIECGGLPFEKLLVKVESSYQGFNLIRYNAECGYDGRCFYIDLDHKDMSAFCEVLNQIK